MKKIVIAVLVISIIGCKAQTVNVKGTNNRTQSNQYGGYKLRK